MESESNSGLTLIYPKPLSEESDRRISGNKIYNNDEKVNQYVLQNNLLNNVTHCNRFSIK